MIDPTAPNFANTPVADSRPRYSYQPLNPAAPPVVSIVTPFYNPGDLFRETVQSVLQQSFQQWEWLIINDASTDEASLRILDEYRTFDPRIRVIDLPHNAGPGAARNAGYQAARTEYIVQVDSDDLLEPTAIETWLWFIETHPEHSFVKGYVVGFGAEEYLWSRGFHLGQEFLNENTVNSTVLIRKQAHRAAGGFDPDIRQGFEDWDFWLRCAQAGHWGTTIPEYLDWYRRRPVHSDRWADFASVNKQQEFLGKLKQRYPDLWQHGMPSIPYRYPVPFGEVPATLPWENHLAKSRPRMLMVMPHLVMGGADKFNLDLLKLLVEQHDYEVTIATTLENECPWGPVFANFTPDIFNLYNFLSLKDFPRFLRYLIRSRQIDTVLILNSALCYHLLPYLRAHCPNVTFMDYIHMEEEYWNNGGYPRYSLNHEGQLDLTVVSSEHLKQWMVERGGGEPHIKVCTTNIDSDDWDPSRYDPLATRRALDIDAHLPIILYAGRIAAQKQPQVFADVLLRLSKEQNQPFICLVAGDGPDRPWLEEFIRSNQLNCVRMLGSVSSQRMRELLAASDIFFLPSLMEGISLAIYEAMSMSVVPVAADVGGQRELVTPDCGFLVERGAHESAAYTAILTKLLAEPEVRARMGRAARHRLQEHYRLEDMGKRMVTLIGRAHELASTRPRSVGSLDLAQTIAINVIEFTRLEQLANRLWAEREAMIAQPTEARLSVPNMNVAFQPGSLAEHQSESSRVLLNMVQKTYNFFSHYPQLEKHLSDLTHTSWRTYKRFITPRAKK